MVATVYLYDGSFEGLLCAVYRAYSEETAEICREDRYELSFVKQFVTVQTDPQVADKVHRTITGLGEETASNVYYLYLSEAVGAECCLLRYLRLCLREGVIVNMAKNEPLIIEVDKLCRHVSYEAIRFEGFVRFRHVSGENYYARIEPDHNILPLLINHFESRFSDQNFIIHDISRGQAIFYNKEESIIAPLTAEQGKQLEQGIDDHVFEEAWKCFYESITIEERRNEKLHRQHMPRRYWRNLTEKS